MAGPVEDLPPGLSQGPQGQGRLRCPGEPHDYNLDRPHKSLEQNQANLPLPITKQNGSDLKQALSTMEERRVQSDLSTGNEGVLEALDPEGGRDPGHARPQAPQQ